MGISGGETKLGRRRFVTHLHHAHRGRSRLSLAQIRTRPASVPSATINRGGPTATCSSPVGPLPQSDQILGHPSELRLRRGTRNQRGRRALESDAQGASDLRQGISEPRRRARGRRRFRRALQPELAPREAPIPDAHRSARNLPATPGRVVQTSVQETGCGTRMAGTVQRGAWMRAAGKRRRC